MGISVNNDVSPLLTGPVALQAGQGMFAQSQQALGIQAAQRAQQYDLARQQQAQNAYQFNAKLGQQNYENQLALSERFQQRQLDWTARQQQWNMQRDEQQAGYAHQDAYQQANFAHQDQVAQDQQDQTDEERVYQGGIDTANSVRQYADQLHGQLVQNVNNFSDPADQQKAKKALSDYDAIASNAMVDSSDPQHAAKPFGDWAKDNGKLLQKAAPPPTPQQQAEQMQWAGEPIPSTVPGGQPLVPKYAMKVRNGTSFPEIVNGKELAAQQKAQESSYKQQQNMNTLRQNLWKEALAEANKAHKQTGQYAKAADPKAVLDTANSFFQASLLNATGTPAPASAKDIVDGVVGGLMGPNGPESKTESNSTLTPLPPGPQSAPPSMAGEEPDDGNQDDTEGDEPPAPNAQNQASQSGVDNAMGGMAASTPNFVPYPTPHGIMHIPAVNAHPTKAPPKGTIYYHRPTNRVHRVK